MFATLLSFDRRAVGLLGLAFAGAAALSACDTDEPVVPKPNAPTAAQPILFPTSATLVIKVVDSTQALITSSLAEFKVVGPNQATWIVKDNIANDADPTSGVVRLKGLTAGQYQICETTAPVNYAMPNPACVTATVPAFTSTTVSIVHQTVARARWSVVDYVPNYVPGMVFTLRDSTNAIVTFITDNLGADSDPAGGKFDIRWGTEGVYNLCEDTPPPGYSFLNGQVTYCTTIQLKHGTIWQNAAPYTVYPTYSAYWHVTDGTVDPNFYPNLIGPSTFTVNIAGGPPITVVDNGVNDINGNLGKIAVKLPSAGTYSICETVPPNGYWNAQPACKQVQVAAAEAGWAEWFVNQEKQVYKP